jgi:hypothetical protein
MIRLILKVEKNVLKNFSQLQVRKKKNEEEDGKEEDDDDEMHLALASFNVDVLANLAIVLRQRKSHKISCNPNLKCIHRIN